MNITATLFGQMITFAILIWFVRKVLWDPLTDAMQARTKRIEEGLAAADHGKKQESLAQKKAKKILREAKKEKEAVISRAQARGSEIIGHAKFEAKEEYHRIIAMAEAEIEREYNQAREKLRKQMSGLILDGAGQVIETEIGAERHNALIDDLAARL